MPTYEYACTSCGRHFDIVQRFSDAPLEVCEVCGGKLKRVFHPVGVVLKGSGFYSTDNRSGKKALTPASKEGASESSSSESSSSGKAEKKSSEKKSSSKKDTGAGSAAS
jgi:putative FmdB family regulatory protein